MRLVFALLLIPFLITPVFAQTNSEILSTEKGTLDVKLSYENIVPGDLANLKIEFINPQTKKTQVHIDYNIVISKSGETIWQTPNLMHTSEGILNALKVEFPEEGVYTMNIEVEGILFSPIPKEGVLFSIAVGGANAQPSIPINNGSEPGGGCLIATATYGSEMATQVQQLRELRDNKLLATESGTAFMTGFNQVYYSFSPAIADFERQQPLFKEFMKVTLTPMISSLSILNHVDMNSEQEVLGYGISIVLLNIGMYVGIPVFGILKLYQFKHK